MEEITDRGGIGYPPVGHPCEAGIPHISGPEGAEIRSILWIPGYVIAYHQMNDRLYAWFAEDDNSFYQPGVYEFRPRQE